MTAYLTDVLTDITIVNGIARLQFSRMEPTGPGTQRQLQPVPEITVGLPLQSFAAAIGTIERASATGF